MYSYNSTNCDNYLNIYFCFVICSGTVVKVWNEFWVSQKSSAVRVRSADQLSATTEYTRPTTTRLVIDDPIYNGCGVNKTCFGIPNNCIAQMNCEAFMSMTPKFNSYVYEMRSPASSKYNIIDESVNLEVFKRNLLCGNFLPNDSLYKLGF